MISRDKVCCCCDVYNGEGKLVTHVEHTTLYRCLNFGCDHYTCEKHKEVCNYCLGCCVEDHPEGHSEEK